MRWPWKRKSGVRPGDLVPCLEMFGQPFFHVTVTSVFALALTEERWSTAYSAPEVMVLLRGEVRWAVKGSKGKLHGYWPSCRGNKDEIEALRR